MINQETKTHACELCGESGHDVFRTSGRGGQPLRTVICHGCGLVYSNPQPSSAEDSDYYKGRYWQSYKGQADPTEAFFQKRIPKVREIASRCVELLGGVESPRALEIGCGAGALSMLLGQGLGERGSVTAIEPSKGHSAWARERTGLDVRQGLLEEVAPGLGEGFDLVVMNHVLEHVQSTRQTCTIVRGLLKDRGAFVIEVPNVEQPGSRLGHYFHEAHNYNFSPNTLSRLALVSGFEIEEMTALDGDLPGTRLFAVLRKTDVPMPEELPADDASERAGKLESYGRWYSLTLASLRKKIEHARRKRRLGGGLVGAKSSADTPVASRVAN